MIKISEVKSICELGLKNRVGIRSLAITDQENYSNLGQLAPGAEVYSIAFTKWSGSYMEDGQTSQAGDYYVQTAKVVVPRYRYVCDRLVRELKDRRVVVFVTDMNGDEHTMTGARLRSRFSTGEKPGDKAGYEWTFAGQGTKKDFYQQFNLLEFTGTDGYQEGGDFEQPLEPDGGPPTGPEACCITILTTAIEFTPTPTGNSMHRNKVVTVAATGEKYFIDKNGISIRLSSTLSKERVVGTGAAVYTLSEVYDPEKTIVNRMMDVLVHEDSPPPEDIRTFNIDGDQLQLPTDWPLEPGEWIEVYKVA